MTDDQKDPRRDVLAELHDRMAASFAGLAREHPPTDTETLKALDAADPLRAMLGEVVEALEGLVEGEGDGLRDLLKARIVLTRLRTLTPTEGGTDDDAQ